MREYPGDFEVHLTVRAGDAARLAEFQEWCRARGFKCVRIVLARGVHVEQPMATWRRGDSMLSVVRDEALALAGELTAQGLLVVRSKIEAAPENAEVPQTDAEALEGASSETASSEAASPETEAYFEHHVKLSRQVDAPREGLVEVCERHGAHLSRNALREAAAGREERFVTLRCYRVGRATSDARRDALMADLKALGEEILEYESEYSVFDTNLALDAGWLNGSALESERARGRS